MQKATLDNNVRYFTQHDQKHIINLSGFFDGAFYGNRPAYTVCYRTNGTQTLQTDYTTRKYLNNCWLKPKDFAIHLHRTAWIIMSSTAVVNHILVYKLLSQTLDINPRFVLQFVVYCILFIVSIQLLLLHQINHYYYYYYFFLYPR